MSSTHWPPGGIEEGPVVVMAPDQGPRIIMPSPGNIIFSDGHEYTGINLTDSTIGKALAAGKSLQGAFSEGGFRSIGSNLLNKDIAAKLAVGGAFGGVAQTIALAASGDRPAGAIVNPQTRTLYTGSAVRTYQFNFKLVPKSIKEMNNVHEIHNTIRKYSYPNAAPGTNNMILEFPSVWTISFKRIENTPNIMPCFLTSFTTTFNASTLIWREDNNPVEIDLSVAFTETRPPTRNDL